VIGSHTGWPSTGRDSIPRASRRGKWLHGACLNAVGNDGVPKALVGTLHVIAAERVEILAMSVSAALDVLSRLGVGFAETLSKDSVAATSGT
jgi:hypothetical protein